ncbi:hypothetical protein RSAG8_09881, partial [Rhizoctonia solani AG-8 WAC10335]
MSFASTFTRRPRSHGTETFLARRGPWCPDFDSNAPPAPPVIIPFYHLHLILLDKTRNNLDLPPTFILGTEFNTRSTSRYLAERLPVYKAYRPTHEQLPPTPPQAGPSTCRLPTITPPLPNFWPYMGLSIVHVLECFAA